MLHGTQSVGGENPARFSCQNSLCSASAPYVYFVFDSPFVAMALSSEPATAAAMTAEPTAGAAGLTGPTAAPTVSPTTAAPTAAVRTASQAIDALRTPAAATTSFSSTEIPGAATSGASAAPVGKSATSFCRAQEEKAKSLVEADVLIVGTGLVGCLTAAALARRDLKVVQIDGKGIYGGTCKSLKLSELCDWVKTDNREKDKTPWCYRQTAAPCNRIAPDTPAGASTNLAVAAPPATEATRPLANPASAKLKKAAATGAAAGELAAALVSPAATESASEVTSAPVFMETELMANQVTPAASGSTLYEDVASSRSEELHEHATAEKCEQYFGVGAETATTADFLRPLRIPSTCVASSAEGAASSRRCSFSERPQWVCSLEEDETGVSFSLRREKLDFTASHELPSAVKRPNSRNADMDKEQRFSSPVAREAVSRNPVEIRAAVSAWGDSEHVFFSSRFFSFFPFATDKTAQPATQCSHSTTTANVSFKRTPLHFEKDGQAHSNGERKKNGVTTAVVDQEQKYVPMCSVPCAADAEAAVCIAAATDGEFRPDPRFSFAFTDALSKQGISSGDLLFVESTPTPTRDGSSGVSAVDEKELLLKKLLKSNNFSIDLCPRILYSNSAITRILVTCGAAKYLEFRPVDAAVYLGELDAEVSDNVLCRCLLEQGGCDGQAESGERQHRRHQSSTPKRQRTAANADLFPSASAVSDSKCRVHDETGQAQEAETTWCRSDTRTRSASYLRSPFSASTASHKKASYFSKGSRGAKKGTSEEAAAQRRMGYTEQLLIGTSKSTERVREDSAGEETSGVQNAKSCPEEGNGEKKSGDSVEKELDLIQMPLTRGAIFSSSLLSTQEKRLLMKFISNVAAPKLNGQFLSAARLWTARMQAVGGAYFDGDRDIAGGAATGAAMRGQPGASSRAAGRDKKDDSTLEKAGGLSCETGTDAVTNRQDALRSLQQSSIKSDVELDDISWEAYLQFHHLTEKLQRYLSYGVCVSDFPLRYRTNRRSQEHGTHSAATTETAITGEEGRGVELHTANRTCEDEEIFNEGCCLDGSWKASEGHARLVNFLQSIGLYENRSGAWLYPIYGTGDLPQALARAASLSGGVYMLHAGMVELKFACPRSRLIASSSCFARNCQCLLTPASSYVSSPLAAEFAELHASVDTGENEASKSQFADGNTVLSKVKSLHCGKGDVCDNGTAFFLSKFQTAMANAEALEAKLRTGITVRTRVLLFEADALPPLSERVRVHRASKTFSHASRQYTHEPASKCHILNCASPVEAPARCSVAGARSRRNAPFKNCMKVGRSSSNGAKEDAYTVGKAVCQRSESPQLLNNEAAASSHSVHAVEEWKEKLFAHTAGEQSTVSLGELLFPVLRLGMTQASAPYAVSGNRKREEHPGVKKVIANRTEREMAIEKEVSLRSNGSPPGGSAFVEGEQRQRSLSAVDKPYSGQATHGEAVHGHSEGAQPAKKRIGETATTCNTPHSRCDYYAQASCHLIALCRRSVLNGPGFRMCVCTVRSKETFAFPNSTGLVPSCWRASTVSRSKYSGVASMLKPEKSAKESASGTSFATSSTALTESKMKAEKDARSKRRIGDSKLNIPPESSRPEVLNQTRATGDALSTPPIAVRTSTSADSPTRAPTALWAIARDCDESESAEDISRCTCSRRQARFSNTENSVARGSKSRLEGSAHRAVGTRSRSPTQSRHASGTPDVSSEMSAACQTNHAGATVAWPVLVLQTDGTCGTTPADYVLLHLSHIDGVGVEACGCSSRGEFLRKSSDSVTKDVPRRDCVLRHKGCASPAAPGTTNGVQLCKDKHKITNLTRHEEALTSAARAASASSVGTGLETSALRAGHTVHACCKKSESRPCEMLMYVLRRLLERGRHCGAAAQDCVFVCSYVSRTLRPNLQKQLQAWQSAEFRGIVQKNSKNLEVTGYARRRHSSDRKQHSSERGTQSVVENKSTFGPVCSRQVEAAPDAARVPTAAAFSPDGNPLDVSQQCSGATDKGCDMSLCIVSSEASSLAKERNNYSQTGEDTSSSQITSEDTDERNVRAAAGQCACLLLPTVPSTPLLFLLQEPKASQQVVEVLLDQQLDVADLVPAHVGHEAEVAEDHLQRLSAPYDKLSEIVARIL